MFYQKPVGWEILLIAIVSVVLMQSKFLFLWFVNNVLITISNNKVNFQYVNKILV